MPLSTVCVSTVSSRPRAWASYSNIRAKDVQGLVSMNSAEEISRYKQSTESYYSPTLNRRFLGYGYDFPEKSPKKEKKWSIGSLFRRKKKDESDSSSDEDPQKKSFLARKKRKSEKKKKGNKPVGTFDHVVLSRNSHLNSNGFKNYEDAAVLSDPSTGYAQNKVLTKNHAFPEEQSRRFLINEINNSRASLGSGSADSLNKKPRKGLAKVRAEARRLTLKHDSSSDEDSQRSASSSRFRSDDSLGIQRESSFSRRSRAARTERYLRRHSKDGENPSNYLRISKSDVENSALNWRTSDDSNRSLSRSPLVPKAKSVHAKTSFSSLSSQSPSLLGLSTIPPSHGSHHKIKVSNSTSNPSYKPPLSMNEYNLSTKRLSDDYLSSQRSVSCDANIHKAPSTEISPEIIHVQFPLTKPGNRFRNLSLVDPKHVNLMRQPPPPPPRDPRRLVTAQYYDNNPRPNTFYFDSTGQIRSKSFNSQTNYPSSSKRMTTFNLNSNNRSTSEDHLPKNNIQLLPRPSSTTPETSNRLIRRPEEQSNPENYNYLTDKKPRSRKPIFIKKHLKENTDKTEAQKALDFWKQKEKATKTEKSQSTSPQMFMCQTHVQTQVFLPSVLQNDINDHLSNSKDTLTVNDNMGSCSPFKATSPSLTKSDKSFVTDETDKDEDLKRKSSNLEEALDELEAIYNSLRLGDEDLLERAEQREKDAAAKKLLNGKNEMYIGWGMAKGALSDSGFSYEPFDTVDSPRRKRLLKKSQTIDRRTDDMAFRKLNKERAQTINDPQSVLSTVSYLQASPIYGSDISNDLEVTSSNHKRTKSNKKTKEPNITLDDVVYRNLKYVNNSNPKVIEPQPPFGIPLGPITLAANSDYLHAVPENIHRPAFKPRKIPDLVKDDLAFRNLRKDESKEPALPPLSPDDLKNNNAAECKIDLNSLKKKRAVRSLSANIGSLINKDVLVKGLERYHNNNVDREHEFRTLTDIADAMEIARKVLKEKENKISATRRAFLSDTDTNNGNCDLSESRMNFLNSLKHEANEKHTKPDSNYLHTKPPTPDRKSPRSPKESTPIPISPLEGKLFHKNNDSTNSSLDDLLTALATEARETNERITNELNHYRQDKKNENSKSSNELDKKLSEIDAVSEQAKLCEKLLEGVVDSNDLMTSDVKPALEEVREIKDEPVMLESVANIILTRSDDKKSSNTKSDKAACESDHDYENLISDKELELEEIISDEEKKCTSPFEEHKAELIASFQELKKNVDDDFHEKTASEKLQDSNQNKELVTGEEFDNVLDSSASKTKECACVKSLLNELDSHNTSNNCDLCFTSNNKLNIPHHSDTETSSGFHSNSSVNNDCVNACNNLDSLESLKSPKLVLQTAKLSKQDANSRQILENQSMICRDDIPSTSSHCNPSRFRRNERDEGNNCEPGHILDDDDDEKASAWYRDPATVAVACSYGIACAHQLASLDFVAILGILFAVLSFIAALIF